ncbi:hypothetical protein GIS00_13645 [Nakamurella sp. YIM 132087]|uniref:Phosphoribosyltransferase n=1 Tax=Nakamurella alba TaxID=2665158 RepID=A0A7K1FP31_9ACTN|nr:phosphoribosyltransferase domain-containing protein [Nakamurella alba]MTD14983.1 hypothetical protein [Nakamurella alba]
MTAVLPGWVTESFGVSIAPGSSPVGLEVTDLVRLALRRNPRRAHLLVSTVLGKHLPVDVRTVAGAGRLLGALVRLRLVGGEVPGSWVDAARRTVVGGDRAALLDALPAPVPTDCVVLGYAETATALGHLVAEQLGARWTLHSTRRPDPGVPVTGTFEEGHSHATTHLLQPVPADQLTESTTLVLVDDELSTGRTAIGTIRELHATRPHRRYVLACLVDLRSAEDHSVIDDLAAELGVVIEVVALASGTVRLPDGLLTEVSDWQDAHPVTPALDFGPLLPDPADVTSDGSLGPGAATPAVGSGILTEVVDLAWPAGLPESGRHGLALPDHPGVTAAAERAAAVVRSLLPAGTRTVTVVGTEEFMYVPVLIGLGLAAAGDLQVGFQSTTRSPVWPADGPGYPVRRRFVIPATDAGVDAHRYLYNAFAPDGTDTADEADVVVLVGDHGTDPAQLAAAAGVIASAGTVVLPVRVAAVPVLPEPLRGPAFGSYPTDDVAWLLTDLSHLDLEADVAQRERLIQAGQAHYAESLPVEYQPDATYQQLFAEVLAGSAQRLATAVGVVTELVLAERGHDVVLVSLARAGTPIGVLMRRWAQQMHGLDLPHYAVSIVRGRGIDRVALGYLARHHTPSSVVFVDGWTGKGAIAKELSAALAEVRETDGWDFVDDLAVLADPGECVRTFGTRDDFLIASACLNSTVSGLVSRTVLNPDFLRPDQFHGAKFYADLADGDVSQVLVDAVAAEFDAVRGAVSDQLTAVLTGDRSVTFAGWAAIERIREEYGISSVNFVKPGVGETTRVLLRRVPWRILVREADHPDHAHLRLLAADRGVPVEVRPDLPYSCVGLIRPLSAADRGEG